jgi:hypothetical protein
MNRTTEVGVPLVASPPTITDTVYMNCSDSFYFDWVMKAPHPVTTTTSLLTVRWLVDMLPYSPHNNQQLNSMQQFS